MFHNIPKCFCLPFCINYLGSVSCQFSGQELVDYLAEKLQLEYAVTTNLEDKAGYARTFGTITFTNTGMYDITDNSWEIYFCSIRLFEPETLWDFPLQGKELGTSKLAVYHINGCLHKISPMAGFTGFPSGVAVVADYVTSDWQSSRTDVSPNWYVEAGSQTVARTILSTAGQSLDFVTDFDTPEQWKRRDFDEYNPYTAQDRYDRNADVSDMGSAQHLIMPTPNDVLYISSELVDLSAGGWLVVSNAASTNNAAKFLSGKSMNVHDETIFHCDQSK